MTERVLTAAEEQEVIDRRTDDEAETFRTQRNIKNTLKYQLKKEYGFDRDRANEVAEKILKVHGLSKDSLDIVNFLHRSIVAQHSQDVSVDANANKESNTITSLIGESVIPYQKLLGYDMLYRQMKKDWGKKEAKTLSALMYDYSLAIHDSGKLMIPYCWAFDASKIVFLGRPFGQVKSKPPKRVSSYIAALDETIHQMAGSHLAGAVAISTFFSDIAFILINREHIDLETVRKDPKVRKYIENCVQTFIYSVNHLSRSSNESPFTNVSIFDRPKLRALFSEDNMGWMFHTDEGEIDPEYFYDMMEEIQDIFVDLFDKGDPLAGGMPFRFPVVTLNFSKTKDGELDPDSEPFLDWASKKEIYRYNIFTSLGTKVASCCYSADTNLTVTTFDSSNTAKKNTYPIGEWAEKYLKGSFEAHIDSEEYVPTDTGYARITGVRRIPNVHRRLLGFTLRSGDVIKVTPDHRFMKENGTWIEARFIKLGMELMNSKGIPGLGGVIEIEEIENTFDTVYDIEVDSSDHTYYMADGAAKTHNCRLINNAELNELGASVNSFGGSALSMGSHRVVLLDTNRYALELQGKGDADDFLKLLDDRIEQATKILLSHRHMLAQLRDDGFLMFLENGWMDLDRMFSTIGLIGLIETVETLNKGLDEKDGDKKLTMEDMLVFINKKVNELSTRYHIPMNIEQVPGEAMAPRLAKVDKYIFGEDKVPYELYSNQFVPLWVDATVFERMEQDGKFNLLFTGGGIVHFNLGERTTPQQNKELIRFAIKCGSEHFALNTAYAQCVDGHITLGKNDKCPICGKDITDYMTRVVGFMVRVSKMNETRREWEFPRRKFRSIPSAEEIDKEISKIS